MKHTADFWSDMRISILGNASSDNTGNAIDCKGAEEALCFYVQDTMTGSTPTNIVKWQDSLTTTSGDFADITSAVHKTATINLASVVAVVNLTNVALTILAQPTNPSRLIITVVDTTPGIVAGTITIVGYRPPTLNEGLSPVAVSETISCAAGAGTYRSTYVYTSVTSITTSAFSVLGGAGDETIKVGEDNTGYGQVHLGRINLVNRKRYLRAMNTHGGSAAGIMMAGLVLFGQRYRPAPHALGATPEFSIS